MHKVPDVYLQLSLLGMYVCMNVVLPRLCPCRDLLDETLIVGGGEACGRFVWLETKEELSEKQKKL